MNTARRVAWPLAFVFLICYGLWLLRGGYLFYEGAFFLSNFLDDKPLASRLFSPHFTEWDCYQGRELSFLFGLIDARVISLSAVIGHPHLYSASSVIASFVSATGLWKLFRRIAPRLSIHQAALIVSLMLTTPPVALTYYYYRPAKALAAMLLVLLCLELSRLISRDDVPQPASPRAILVFFITTSMCLSDRQGVYFAIVILALMATLRSWSDLPARRAIIALITSITASAVWNLLVGPRISAMVDGYLPDTTAQRLSIRSAFLHSNNYVAALDLWRDQVNFFLGNWGNVAAVACITIIVVILLKPVGETKVSRSRWLVACVGTTAALFLLAIAMYSKLPSIAWPESRRVYYWIPQMAVVAIVVAIVVDRSIANWPSARVPLTIVLAAMLCTNVAMLPLHRAIIAKGEQALEIAESSRLRDCMRGSEPQITVFELSTEGAQACASVRMSAFGSYGEGVKPIAVSNPALYCRGSGRRP